MKRILVYITHPHVDAWNFTPLHAELLQEKGYEVTLCFHSRDFLRQLPQAEAAVVWYFKKEWLQSAANLQLIATPAAGAEGIDVEPTPTLKIWFGGFHGLMMAESVLGAMLYFCKAFPLSAQMQSRRKWAPVKISERLRSLYRARVTIVGFGRIGAVIAGAVKPFGCTITGVKRTPAPAPEYFSNEDRIVTVEKLPEALQHTDHLILVLPGGADTEGLITRDHLRALPNTSHLYNVGRGNAVREADLVDALQKGEIAGAYLDVFEEEPLPETSPLWEMENVLIQPHLSAASPHYLDLFIEELILRLLPGPLPGEATG